MRYCLNHNDAIESHEFEEYSLESVINMIKRSMTLINTGKYTDTFTSLKMLSLYLVMCESARAIYPIMLHDYSTINTILPESKIRKKYKLTPTVIRMCRSKKSEGIIFKRDGSNWTYMNLSSIMIAIMDGKESNIRIYEKLSNICDTLRSK